MFNWVLPSRTSFSLFGLEHYSRLQLGNSFIVKARGILPLLYTSVFQNAIGNCFLLVHIYNIKMKNKTRKHMTIVASKPPSGGKNGFLIKVSCDGQLFYVNSVWGVHTRALLLPISARKMACARHFFSSRYSV